MQDGTTLGHATGLPTCNVRLLVPLPAAAGAGMLCAAGDGALWALNQDGSTVLSSAALPGTPAASAAAAVEMEQQSTASPEAAGQDAADGSAAADAEGAGPEFVPDHGYRGHRCAANCSGGRDVHACSFKGCCGRLLLAQNEV